MNWAIGHADRLDPVFKIGHEIDGRIAKEQAHIAELIAAAGVTAVGDDDDEPPV